MSTPVIRTDLVAAAKRHIGKSVVLYGYLQQYYRDLTISEVDADPSAPTNSIKIADPQFDAAYEIGVDPRIGGRLYQGMVELTGTIVADPTWPPGVAIDKLTRAIVYIYGETHDVTQLFDQAEQDRVLTEFRNKYSGN